MATLRLAILLNVIIDASLAEHISGFRLRNGEAWVAHTKLSLCARYFISTHGLLYLFSGVGCTHHKISVQDAVVL